MKKLIIIILLITTGFAFSQDPGGPKVNAVKFIGEMTTAVRDLWDVPVGEVWMIYNTTTTSLEYATSNDIWIALATSSGGGSGAFFSTTSQNFIEVGTSGPIGSTDYVRLAGGTTPNEVYLYLTDNYASLSSYSIADIDAVGASSLITREWAVDYVSNNSPGSTDDQVATEVPFTANANITSTNVQAAIEEVYGFTAGGSYINKTATNQFVDIGTNSGTFWELTFTDSTDPASSLSRFRSFATTLNLITESSDASTSSQLQMEDDKAILIVDGGATTKQYTFDDDYSSNFSVPNKDDITAALSALLASDIAYTNNSQTTVEGALDDLYSNAGDPNQTLSIGGSESDQISISGTEGNTISIAEGIQDNIGNMITGNTESGIDVSYDDVNGKVNFNVTASGTPDDDSVTTAKIVNGTIIPEDIDLSQDYYFSGASNDFQTQFDIRGLNTSTEAALFNFKTFDDVTTNAQVTYSKGLTLPGLGFKNSNAGANDWFVLKDSGGADYDGVFTANSFVIDGATSDDILLGDGTTTSLSGISGGSGVTTEQAERISNIGVPLDISISNDVALTNEYFDPSTTPDRGKGVWAYIQGDHTITVNAVASTKATRLKAPPTGTAVFNAGTGIDFAIPDESVNQSSFILRNGQWVVLKMQDSDTFDVIGPVEFDTQAPTVPANLASSAQGETTVDLTWNASTDDVEVDYYELSIDDGTASNVGNVTSYQATGLTSGTAYDFKVRAVDVVGNTSSYTSNLNVTTDSALSYPNQSNVNPEEVDDHGWSITNNANTAPGTFSLETDVTVGAVADTMGGLTTYALEVVGPATGNGKASFLTNTLRETLIAGEVYVLNGWGYNPTGNGCSLGLNGGLGSSGTINSATPQYFEFEFTYVANRVLELDANANNDGQASSARYVFSIKLKED